MPSANFDFFDLNEPSDFFRLIKLTMVQYARNPDEKDFLFLALGFTHLREWISESDRDQIAKKQAAGVPLTPGEEFFATLEQNASFNTVRRLCNRGKHHITKSGGSKTSKISQFRVGIGRVGDHFGQKYFMIDNVDSRNYFWELTQIYNEWFNSNSTVNAPPGDA